MSTEIIILILEAVSMYFLVLGTHALRHRYGPAHFYALIGGLTAVMSWVTDAGLAVDVAGIRFVVGSTVFYTSLLLSVFVTYVFDGPRATRVAISTVAGVSTVMPLIAAVLHAHMAVTGSASPLAIPQPSFRINAASVATTLLDLVFLGIAWEFLGKPSLKISLWFRTWLTLLGVMWLDVFLFATGAFAGTPVYLNIMMGTLVSRFVISLFALPFLYGYLHWQSNREGVQLEKRPVLAILHQVAEIEAELSSAEQELERRQRAEEALRESHALLDATGELASVGGWHVDLPSLQVRWTEQTRRLVEVPDDYQPSLDGSIAFYQPDDQVTLRRALERAIEDGEPFDLELRLVTAAGNRRWVRILCRPRTIDGDVVELLGAFHDVTERRAMERRLRQQERMAAVGQMASGVAHDFRNRVNAILLYAEMVLNNRPLPEPVAKSLRTITSESRAIAELVQQILDFSGRSMLDLQRLDLKLLLEDGVDHLRCRLPDGVSIVLRAESDHVLVEADRERMLQAFHNLVSNACDAMPEGGQLTVTLSCLEVACEGPSPDLNHRGWLPDDLPAGEWVCLSVADQGTGMTEEVRRHLFEPFFTTKDIDQGTGLGLAQVYGIVRQHEGLIDVETELGAGTTVRIYLPAYCEAVAGALHCPSGLEERRTVLLVEPNETLRRAQREILEDLGHHVIAAQDAPEALALTQSPRWVPATCNGLDLVLTRLEMPSVTGEDLLEKLRRGRPYLKAIAVADSTLTEDELAAAGRAGFTEIIASPLEPDILAHLVRRVLGRE